jgi:murein DD-endopeptidase MepM/ murein hydrolase activator NlpD
MLYNPKIKTKIKSIIHLFLTFSLLGWFFYPGQIRAAEYTMEPTDNLENLERWQINQDINEKRSEIQELNKQIEVYNKNIKAKQKELNNLSGQISTLSQSIAKINLEIAKVGLEIETLNLKIENAELKIQAKEKEIADQKDVVAEVLRTLHREQQKSGLLEILVLNNSFSDFMSEVDRLENIQNHLVQGVEDLNTVKLALNDDKGNLENNLSELDTLQSVLDNKIGALDSQKVAKYNLIDITQGQQAKYQQMLEQARKEQEQINSDIVYLEKVAREKLNRQLAQVAIDTKGEGLGWPVGSRVITAYFHDPDYPYRYIFEHPAIDIATPQGTAIKAAEAGYVAIAKSGGKTGYSYIMVVHAGGTSTVYGHVNKINVTVDQFVTKGQVIGYSGGVPGTSGAGPFSTGPHLHFELRINGVPVNALNYLP